MSLYQKRTDYTHTHQSLCLSLSDCTGLWSEGTSPLPFLNTHFPTLVSLYTGYFSIFEDV